ncbi:hypothetical protein PTKU46_57940 [Paraburkholderia terrae]|uniref:Mu transposase C-terminal domain-containing protein n=1 Tax=Paraburkholderia terrae TaxID=311230 RepID=UPI0030E41B41
MILYPNELVQFASDASRHRIVWMSTDADALFYINVDKKKSTFRWDRRSKWEDMLSSGELVVLADDPFIRIPVEASLGQAAKDRRDGAWEAIRDIVEQAPSIFNPRFRGPLLRSVAAAHNVHEDTVKNWLIEYFRRGMTKNALLTDHDRCGGRGKERKPGLIKRGRPRSTTDSVGINADDGVKQIFRVAIANYRKNGKLCLRAAYRQMLRKFYAHEIEIDSRNRIVLKDENSIPTFSEFYYWHKKWQDIKQEVTSRRGKKFYERMMRELLGNSTDEAIGPGYRYQIDATIADVYLVSKTNPKDIIGRPVLYVVIDVWSRKIVGIYVGIQNASWEGAMMALLNAASDKTEFCARHGIELLDGDWDAVGISSVVLGDRGELESRHAERMSDVLGVRVENPPAYRPDWKGLVEVCFKTLPARFAPFVDGYIEVDYQERGAQDYRLDATLTLDEFSAIMIQCVLDHNNQVLEGYPLTADMLRDGVVPSPNRIWQWGIKNRSGLLKKYGLNLLRFALMVTSEASVTKNGIEFLGRLYACDYADENRWHSKARQSSPWKVPISYDPRCLDEFLMHDRNDRRAFKVCTLKSQDEAQHGLSMQEVLSLKRTKKLIIGAGAHDRLEDKINREHAIESIVAKARARKESAGPDTRSKKERTGDIRPNKASERAIRAKEESFRFKEQGHRIASAAEVRPAAPKTGFAMPNVFDWMKDE